MYEEFTGYDTVKQKLIIAGINELQMHGITDFSLRRVAAQCNISCAAPYKHFKDKESFIREIIAYIDQSWEKLSCQVYKIYSSDKRKLLVEMCIAYIRFWIANPNFRAVLMMGENIEKSGDRSFRIKAGRQISDTIENYFSDQSADYASIQAYKIRSLVYGALLMLDDGELENNDKTVLMIKKCIEEQL